MEVRNDEIGLVENEEPPAQVSASATGHATIENTPNDITVDIVENGVAHNDVIGNGVEHDDITTVRHPVTCATRHGDDITLHEQVVTTRADGSKVIITRDMEAMTEERPLKERDLKFIKIFSIISIILFFPTGLPAFYYAMATERAFREGIRQGNLDLARKKARKAERLIILSIIGALFAACLGFALAEYSLSGGDYYNAPSYAHFSRFP